VLFCCLHDWLATLRSRLRKSFNKNGKQVLPYILCVPRRRLLDCTGFYSMPLNLCDSCCHEHFPNISSIYLFMPKYVKYKCHQDTCRTIDILLINFSGLGGNRIRRTHSNVVSVCPPHARQTGTHDVSQMNFEGAVTSVHV
jgi:hypothetical protein